MNPTGTDLFDANAAPTNSLVERLAQLMSNSVAAKTIFATPVERDGVTVIPVARAYYGFGGGSGTSPKAGPGSGGGGGASIMPMGYIEIKDGSTRFRGIRRSAVPLVAVSGLVALLLMRSIPGLWRRPRIGAEKGRAQRVY